MQSEISLKIYFFSFISFVSFYTLFLIVLLLSLFLLLSCILFHSLLSPVSVLFNFFHFFLSERVKTVLQFTFFVAFMCKYFISEFFNFKIYT